ncbi:DUF397 domain-containing protein [Streptomyces sp. MMBL 11-3]|uniref:DUF397 domain-containing protein n=1 Tax=Streptomyces sp. MMBL 11-3 TaxID=3382639 RepID=UPI0039B67FB7
MLIWRKSSASDPSTCVEVALAAGGVRVRDSKRPTGPSVAFEATAWEVFLCDLCEGHADRAVR